MCFIIIPHWKAFAHNFVTPSATIPLLKIFFLFFSWVVKNLLFEFLKNLLNFLQLASFSCRLSSLRAAFSLAICFLFFFFPLFVSFICFSMASSSVARELTSSASSSFAAFSSVKFYRNMFTGIVSDYNSISLWHESEDINNERKKYFQSFSWSQFYAYIFKLSMIMCSTTIGLTINCAHILSTVNIHSAWSGKNSVVSRFVLVASVSGSATNCG